MTSKPSPKVLDMSLLKALRDARNKRDALMEQLADMYHECDCDRCDLKWSNDVNQEDADLVRGRIKEVQAEIKRIQIYALDHGIVLDAMP